MSSAVHWLFPKEVTHAEVLASHLASMRLRSGVAGDALLRAGFQVSFGEQLPRDVRVLCIPKIGSDNIIDRSEKWINIIIEAKTYKALILLDYTDHHVGFDSPMRAFYLKALELSDIVVVPSAAMKKNLSNFVNKDPVIICDALEYASISPRTSKNSKPTILWFGHHSNLSFLISFCNNYDLRDRCDSLVIVTSMEGINWVKSNYGSLKLPAIKLVAWSVVALAQAALQCDLALLPTGLGCLAKSGASSNRLLTAFALGLPVITNSIDSYLEFREFYTDIDECDLDAVFNSPEEEHSKVVKVQELLLPRYSPRTIGGDWLRVIVHTGNSYGTG